MTARKLHRLIDQFHAILRSGGDVLLRQFRHHFLSGLCAHFRVLSRVTLYFWRNDPFTRTFRPISGNNTFGSMRFCVQRDNYQN